MSVARVGLYLNDYASSNTRKLILSCGPICVNLGNELGHPDGKPNHGNKPSDETLNEPSGIDPPFDFGTIFALTLVMVLVLIFLSILILTTVLAPALEIKNTW